MLNGLLKKYNKMIEVITIILFSSLMISVVIQVFYRYILNTPITWIEELSRILLIWTIFMGSIIAHYNHGHPKIEYFIDRIPDRLRIYFRIFGQVIIYLVLFCMFYYGIKLFGLMELIRTPALRMPFKYIVISIPITAVSMFFNHIRFTYDLLHKES